MTTDYPEHGKVVIKLEETSKEPLTIRQCRNKTDKSITNLFYVIRQALLFRNKYRDISHSMPDNVDRRAVFYGPTILAGTFGTEKRKMGDIPVFVSIEWHRQN